MTQPSHQPAGKSTSTWYGIVEEDDQSEPLPTELNTVDHPRFLAVGKDKLTVRYVGRGNHSQDVGAVRTNCPCPQRCLVYYYEVTILEATASGIRIAVGMADGDFQLNRQPGWESSSYAYAGYDGRRYCDSERGESYGPRFGAGDVRHSLSPHPVQLLVPHCLTAAARARRSSAAVC